MHTISLTHFHLKLVVYHFLNHINQLFPFLEEVLFHVSQIDLEKAKRDLRR